MAFASSYILISVHSKCKTNQLVILVFFFSKKSFFYIKKRKKKKLKKNKPQTIQFLENTTVGYKFFYEKSEDLEVHADQAKTVVWKLDICASFLVYQSLIKRSALQDNVSPNIYTLNQKRTKHQMQTSKRARSNCL